jgi:hypothetical protein
MGEGTMRGRFNPRLGTLMLALCAVAIVATACGSDDGEDSSGNPKAEIKTVLVESFEIEDLAELCEENLTEAALEEGGFEGKDREARVESCKEDKPVDLNEVTVSKVKVNGSTATAEVTHTNQNGGRSTFAVRLRDEGGWKIDRLLGAR